jgi:predicted metal-dependent HD superfamily phosphohydrolase
MDAEGEPFHIAIDRMKCGACGHEEICDHHQIKDDWNEYVASDEIPRERWHLLPSVRFEAVWTALGARGQGRAMLLELRAAYDEPHRAYHTARHIGACLRLLDDAAVSALAERGAEIEAAIWFHDAIYDTHAHDNEERSARLVEGRLTSAGVATEAVGRIAAYVRATKDHITDSADGKLMIDIDLSILGEVPEVFMRFEEEIRREYSWVDDAAYVAGRAAVLRHFSDRPFIYGTRLFRDRYEALARENIGASLRRLSAPGRS